MKDTIFLNLVHSLWNSLLVLLASVLAPQWVVNILSVLILISWLIRQLGGLVVKSFACCAGGPGSTPGWGTQHFQMAFISKISASLSIACDVKPEGALYLVFYAEASKRTHTWELRVPCVDSQPYHLIISSIILA